jgi:acetylglutamate synthase
MNREEIDSQPNHCCFVLEDSGSVSASILSRFSTATRSLKE